MHAVSVQPVTSSTSTLLVFGDHGATQVFAFFGSLASGAPEVGDTIFARFAANFPSFSFVFSVNFTIRALEARARAILGPISPSAEADGPTIVCCLGPLLALCTGIITVGTHEAIVTLATCPANELVPTGTSALTIDEHGVLPTGVRSYTLCHINTGHRIIYTFSAFYSGSLRRVPFMD